MVDARADEVHHALCNEAMNEFSAIIRNDSYGSLQRLGIEGREGSICLRQEGTGCARVMQGVLVRSVASTRPPPVGEGRSGEY